MNVKKIVSEYLTANGYGGLHCPITGCGCKLDYLMPCNEVVVMCKPAYVIEKPECGKCRNKCVAYLQWGESADFCCVLEKGGPNE